MTIERGLHYGRVDVEYKMPDACKIKAFERQAKKEYNPHEHKEPFDRFIHDRVWYLISEWQREQKERDDETRIR